MQEQNYHDPSTVTSAETLGIRRTVDGRTVLDLNWAKPQQDPRMDADATTDMPVHVTFFKTFAADRLTTETVTLEQLRERVLNASARKKENPSDKSGLWKVLGAKQAVYSKRDLSLNAQIKAVQELIESIEAAATNGYSQAQPMAEANPNPDEKLDFGRARPQAGMWWTKD
jgi:hypothetical protein